MIQANITLVVATLTLLSHIVFVVFIGLFFMDKSFKSRVYSFVNKYILGILFFASFSALVGSLLYSNVAGFPPCELCWIQRIFMYPQALISFMAMLKGDKGIIYYLFPMSVLGGIVALYHSLTHFGLGDGVLECTSALGDCGKLYVFEYGYITIPLMAVTIFIYLITATIIYRGSTKEQI